MRQPGTPLTSLIRCAFHDVPTLVQTGPMIYVPTWLQVRQDGVAWYVLLHLRYAVRPVSDHAEVCHNFRSLYATRLSHVQGVCRDGEEPLDCLLPVFHEFRAGCCRGGKLDLLRVASRYDLPLFPLKQTSEANSNVESDGSSRPPPR
jgi:hypothetical protein